MQQGAEGAGVPGPVKPLATRVTHGIFLVAERLLTWAINPYSRARLLSLLGANVGENVRVYEARFMNLESGFKNLTLEDDVHIGPGCLIDLADHVVVQRGAVLSPRVVVLSHSDPGEHHGSPLATIYPRRTAPVRIGPWSWIGVNSVLLAGSELGSMAVVGANSLVNGRVPSETVVVGSPARSLQKASDLSQSPSSSPDD
jgi:acetyltransferase-like isoleucine patch superfamily enzyme